MKDDSETRRVRRGYALLAGLIIAAVLVFNLDVVTGWFRGYIEVVALVPETEGVRVGSTVLVEGVDAGHVTDIRFVDLSPDAAIALSVRLDDRVRPALRQGSTASTAKRRFIGEPTVRITAGPPDAPPLEPGDTLWPTGQPGIEELLEQGQAFPPTLDSLAVTLDELQRLVQRRRPALAHLVDRLAIASAEAETLTAALDDGSLRRWMDDPSLGDRVRRLKQHVASIEEALSRFDGSGEDAEVRARLESVTQRAGRLGARLDTLGRSVAEGDGLLGRMGRDSALAVAIAGVTAQVDSLRAAGLDFALEMILP